MPPNKLTEVDEDLIKQLCAIAGVSKVVATNLLEACDNNLEMAVNMHMEGVVTDANELIRTNAIQDEIRAPIPQRQEVLIEGPDQIAFSFRGKTRKTRSVFDKFRDFEAESKHQDELLGEGTSSTDEIMAKRRKKMQTLEDLYRPPLDLMFKGSFQSARDAGIGTKKWLLINVQNSSEFACQVLNRDLWSNAAVKIIIQEHFIFWQIYHDSDEGQRYMNFYPVKEWPYISVVDPRTGECIISWKNMDAVSFCDVITEFLSSQSSLDDCVMRDSPALSKNKTKINSASASIIEADEDAQLEAAIKASLDGNSNGETSTAKGETVNQRKWNLNVNDGKGESDDEDSDFLETFDSDSDHADYSISKNVFVSQKIAKHTDDKDIGPTKQSSIQNAIRARVNRKPEDPLPNGDCKTKDEEEESDKEMFEPAKETWKDYLGKDVQSLSKLILRLPDGSRDIIEMPSTSQLRALVLYVGSRGFSNESYELVTNFPKRQLSYMDITSSLKSLGLFPQETIFVQKR